MTVEQQAHEPDSHAPDRNLALELARVTEAAAMAAARWVGRGRQERGGRRRRERDADADQLGVDARRRGHRRGREGSRADAVQRRGGGRRHRPGLRRRGRPDRRHPAVRQRHAERDLGAGGGRPRLDVRPVRGVLHVQAGHRPGGGRHGGPRRTARRQRPGRGQGQGLLAAGRDRGHPGPSPARRADLRGPGQRRADPPDHRRRRGRRHHGRARGHRHRPDARRRAGRRRASSPRAR